MSMSQEPVWKVQFKRKNDGVILQNNSRIVEYDATFSRAAVKLAIELANKDGYNLESYDPILVDISHSINR